VCGLKGPPCHLIHLYDVFKQNTYSATGPGAKDPINAHGAPSRDKTVHVFDAFPPLCHLWDKHLQTSCVILLYLWCNIDCRV